MGKDNGNGEKLMLEEVVHLAELLFLGTGSQGPIDPALVTCSEVYVKMKVSSEFCST